MNRFTEFIGGTHILVPILQMKGGRRRGLSQRAKDACPFLACPGNLASLCDAGDHKMGKLKITAKMGEREKDYGNLPRYKLPG